MEHGARLSGRFLALTIDGGVIIAYGLVLFGANMAIFEVFLNRVHSFNELGMNLISLTMILPVVIYSIIAEAGARHATVGKRRMGIAVASITGGHLPVWRVVVRNVVKFLPWQLAHMAIFRGFAFSWQLPPCWMAFLFVTDILPLIWVASLFRKDHRGIHDLVAGTVVVDRQIPA